MIEKNLVSRHFAYIRCIKLSPNIQGTKGSIALAPPALQFWGEKADRWGLTPANVWEQRQEFWPADQYRVGKQLVHGHRSISPQKWGVREANAARNAAIQTWRYLIPPLGEFKTKRIGTNIQQKRFLSTASLC